MKKIILWGILAILLFGTLWYFFVKEYDYTITFTTQQASGTVYSTLIAMNNWEPKTKKSLTTLSKTPFSEVIQELKVSDSIFDIKWEIVNQSESITKVTVFLKDKNHSYLQKLKVPFTKTDFTKRSIHTVRSIKEGLKAHQKEYKISSVEKSIFPRKTFAYVTLSCKLNEKAKLMIAHTIDVTNYLRYNNIDLIGNPFLQVIEWDLELDFITFNFCFPIKKQDTYPDSKLVKVKTIEPQEALKTAFNGNYSISDRGWFTLLDYADRHNIEVETSPIEVFFNDPHSDGDELQWQAAIYLPLKK